MTIYYTDGSASPNPGPGGFAVILDGKPARLGNESDTTNIRMEGRALIAAMEHAAGVPCKIYTDSEFWINVVTKWSFAWEANGWRKKGGEIKNLDLVQKACELHRKSQANLIWVRGHDGEEGNELADQWANKARQEKLVL